MPTRKVRWRLGIHKRCNPLAFCDQIQYLGAIVKRQEISTIASVKPQNHQVNLRVALYARVSTANGHQDPAMQLRELRLHAHKHGWEIVGEYVDRGVSGAKESRPELNRLMEVARAGGISI